jgi:hypothetical protein
VVVVVVVLADRVVFLFCERARTSAEKGGKQGAPQNRRKK